MRLSLLALFAATMASEHCASATTPREVVDPATGLRALVFDPPAAAALEPSLAAAAAERGAPLLLVRPSFSVFNRTQQQR